MKQIFFSLIVFFIAFKSWGQPVNKEVQPKINQKPKESVCNGFHIHKIKKGKHLVTNLVLPARTSQLKSYQTSRKQKLDSIIYRDYSEEIGIYEKMEFIYDSNGNNISETYYYGYPGQWEPYYTGVFKYNANGNLESSSLSEPDDFGILEEYESAEYTYDENGNLTGSIISINAVKYKIQFNRETPEKLVQNILVWYDNQWFLSRTEEYNYDEHGNLTLNKGVDYVEGEIDEVTMYKYEYNYDDYERVTLKTSYYWDSDSNQWISQGKNVYTYEGEFQLTEDIYSFSNQDGEYHLIDKEEYFYDTHGNLTENIWVEYDDVEDKYSYNYNNSYSAEDLVLPLIFTLGEIDDFGIKANDYNPDDDDLSMDHMLLKLSRFENNHNPEEWILLEQYEFYYSAFGLVSTSPFLADHEIRIYPNPAADYFIIENNEPVTIEIIDIQGILIKKIVDVEVKGKIDVSFLPSGVYQINLYTEKQILAYKLLKL